MSEPLCLVPEASTQSTTAGAKEGDARGRPGIRRDVFCSARISYIHLECSRAITFVFL